MRRWIKDYWQFIRLDAQGTAATIARCRRRGLFIALSPLVSRKTGFHQVTRPPLELFLRFAAAFGLERDELEAHYACPETMQATYTRLHFQFSSFEEGFVVSALAGEGSLLDVVRDERPWLCQRGIAEYMKRAWKLDDDAVAYWRAYEDFRGFVTEPVWDLVREIAVDGVAAGSCCAPRCTTGCSSTRTCAAPGARSSPAAIRCPTSSGRRPDASLPGRRRADARGAGGGAGRVLPRRSRARPRPPSASCSRARRRSRRRRSWCGTSSTSTPRATSPASCRARPTPRAFRAIAQAFATESGGYLTRNHMEIWADFAEQAFGITREELFRWTPPTETIASRYVTSWFLVHGPPEEAIAAFHLGPPPPRAKRMGKAALGLGQGGVAGEGLLQPVAARTRHPLTAAFERLGVDPDLADYFFRLHREIEPFEQDEGWEYVPEVVRTGPQRRGVQARLHQRRSSRSAARTRACCGA